jgi:hypothetical protein
VTLRAIVLGWIVSTALAGESDKVREAEKHKELAFTLIADGKYAEGIDELERAYQIVPHPTFLFNIAVTYDQWGHCRDSIEAFERFFHACDGCKLEETAKQRRADVNHRCEVTLSITTRPSGAQLIIDGEVRGRSPLEMRVLPGAHELVASLDDHETTQQPFVLEEGKPASIVLSLRPIAATSTSVPSPPPPIIVVTPPPTAAETRIYETWWFWTIVGALALGIAGTTAYLATRDGTPEVEPPSNIVVRWTVSDD